MKPRICEICGKEYIPTGSHQKYCPACKTKSWKERDRKKTRKYHDKIRRIVLEHYGGKNLACACCGETRIEFLTIDHINGSGAKHIKEIGGASYFYRWLIKNNFPKGFRVLCHNCNSALGLYGYCPHEKEG